MVDISKEEQVGMDPKGLEKEQEDKSEVEFKNGNSSNTRKAMDIRLGGTHRKRANPKPVWGPIKIKYQPSATISLKGSDAGMENTETVVKTNETKSLIELKLVNTQSEKGLIVNEEELEPGSKERKDTNNNNSAKGAHDVTLGQENKEQRWDWSS